MMFSSNLASKYASIDEYVQAVLQRLEQKDPSLTTLQIDDFHYPLVDLEGDDDLDNEMITKLLRATRTSPHTKSLELRFVHFDDQVSSAFQQLLSDTTRNWESISVTSCTGIQAEDYCVLAAALERCDRLAWHQNHTSESGFGTFGMALADPSTTLQSLQLKREDLRGDNARALLVGLSSNTSVTRLVLNFCRLDYASVEALADGLAHNTHLELLDLGACYLSDAHTERVLSALRGHPMLRHLILTLNACHFRGAQAMGNLLRDPSCPLQIVNLSHQKDLTTKIYLTPIAHALATNTKLRHLKLSRNRLSPKDVASLFQVLQTGQNSTLQTLDLNGNDISDQGIPLIADAIPKLSGLKELHLLNNNIRLSSSSATLLQVLKHNHTLEVLDIRPFLPHVPQIRYQTALNAAGRQALTSPQPVLALGVWAHILERAAKVGSRNKSKEQDDQQQHQQHQENEYRLDGLYHMLRGPALFATR